MNFYQFLLTDEKQFSLTQIKNQLEHSLLSSFKLLQEQLIQLISTKQLLFSFADHRPSSPSALHYWTNSWLRTRWRRAKTAVTTMLSLLSWERHPTDAATNNWCSRFHNAVSTHGVERGLNKFTWYGRWNLPSCHWILCLQTRLSVVSTVKFVLYILETASTVTLDYFCTTHLTSTRYNWSPINHDQHRDFIQEWYNFKCL